MYKQQSTCITWKKIHVHVNRQDGSILRTKKHCIVKSNKKFSKRQIFCKLLAVYLTPCWLQMLYQCEQKLSNYKQKYNAQFKSHNILCWNKTIGKMKMNDPTTILFSWALPAPLFNQCIKSEILLHTLFLEHHPIKIAHLSYSNSTGSQLLNE